MNTRKLIASDLLTIRAVKLSVNKPFTWASGIKSPIYCDNRLVLSHPKERQVIVEAFVDYINTNNISVDCIVGTSTAGIAWGALVANILDLPFAYVRGSAKDHGLNNKVEGKIEANAKVIIIEDLISTGGSVKDVVEAVRGCEAQVVKVLAIFSYNLLKAEECFKGINCDYATLSDYDTLMEVSKDKNIISDADCKKLIEWKKDVTNPKWMD